MSQSALDFDEAQAITFLHRFLSVEGITGQEKAIAEAVATALVVVGVPRRWIQVDEAAQRIPLPTQSGNLLVHLPGTLPDRPRLLFLAHLDTVPLCAGARPVREGGRIRPAPGTALGGDNRTGVACLVNLVSTLLERKLPHPPLTLLFTVREESGLWGARHVLPSDLGDVAYGFNIDGGYAHEITVGAVGAERWEVEVHGRAAHAGVHPEKGISATAIVSLAIAEAVRGGWFGKVARDGKEGTSNIGSVSGRDGKSAGEATNVVTDYAHVRGESRSHDRTFATSITKAYRQAFLNAARTVVDDRGRKAKVEFRSRRDYYPFRLKDTAPVIQHARSAAEQAGFTPTLRVTNGGLDANWLVKHGIPTITFGAGQRNIHTVEEYVELREYLNGCRMALALATLWTRLEET